MRYEAGADEGSGVEDSSYAVGDSGCPSDGIGPLLHGDHPDAQPDDEPSARQRPADWSDLSNSTVSSVCSSDPGLRELVRRFQRTDGAYPVWKVGFDLTRYLRSRSDAEFPDEFGDAADWFFRSVGIDPELGWAEILRQWPRIRHAEGDGPWDEAVRLAQERPLEIVPSPGRWRSVEVASLAAYLGEMRGGGPFVFSGSKVAKSFGIPERTAYVLIDDLVLRKVIAWQDATFSHVTGKARQAVFTGNIVGPLDESSGVQSR